MIAIWIALQPKTSLYKKDTKRKKNMAKLKLQKYNDAVLRYNKCECILCKTAHGSKVPFSFTAVALLKGCSLKSNDLIINRINPLLLK